MENDNPIYKSCFKISEYIEKCKLEDPEGFELLFSEMYQRPSESNQCEFNINKVVFVDDNCDHIMNLQEYILNQKLDMEYQDEIEYKTKDPVRKFQIDYDKSVCLSEKFPEAFHQEKNKDSNNQLQIN